MKEISLFNAGLPKYYGQNIRFNAVVVGKSLSPFYVPKNVKIECRTKKSKCKECVLSESSTFTIEYTNPNFVKFIGVGDQFITSNIKDLLNIPGRCALHIKTLEAYTVEEVYLTAPRSKNTQNVTRVGYHLGYGLECNIPYAMEAISVPEPRQQKIVHIITSAEPLKTSIDQFSLDEKTRKGFELFQPDDNTVEGIYKFLESLYTVYSRSVTRIYYRFDLHMAVDLVFHSPLSFYFNGEFIKRGWGDAIIIGDTRCGKGLVAEGLCQYYGVGEVLSGENLSFAGLVGGVQQINSRWSVTWGKMPMNDRGLVVIDEAGEVDTKEFSKLSRIRSEGVAEITKIQSEKTQARTRMLYLTNPRSRTIRSYNFGIEALTDVIESPEDLSRFDYCLVIAHDEVSLEDINTHIPSVNNPYAKYDPDLVLWCWSRNPKQVVFERESEKLILKLSIKLGNIYSSHIPLIQGENVRIKLAKVSAMIAGRLFSTDSTYENLIIKPQHVEAAYVFLNMIYKKKHSGYYACSQLKRQSTEVLSYDGLEEYLNTFENRDILLDYLIHNNKINIMDMSEHVNQPRDICREIISSLIKFRCISKKLNFYVKNQPFVDWLKSKGW